MNSPILTELDPDGSILFLGSGFSKSAINIRGDELPTGDGLKKHLADLLDVDPSAHDLPDLADAVDATTEIDLYRILYETFTVTNLSASQTEILQHPWLRIYTTNYDDSIELFRSKNQLRVSSFSYDEEKPHRLPNGAVIHLHGVIRNATEENVLSALVLNEAAYVRQHFEHSVWYQEFVRDLKICTACYFVGYSLKDYHISAILLQRPALRNKTYFITDAKQDRISSIAMNRYGQLLPIGMDRFSVLCRTLPAPQPTLDPHSMKLFRFLDPLRDKRTLSPPTVNEIRNLFIYGKLDFQRCLSTLPRPEYVVPRQAAADFAAEKLRECRCLLVHSRVGNGKTAFLHILVHQLFEDGYQCFWCRSSHPQLQSFHPQLQRDIRVLATFRQAAIIFDDYDMAIELVGALAERLPSAKFLIAVRTGVQDVRAHEIAARLPGPLARVNLNRMHGRDREHFRSLLEAIGTPRTERNTIMRNSNDIRDVVIGLFENRTIKESIDRLISQLLSDDEVRGYVVSSHLLRWVGRETDDSMMRVISNLDPYAITTKYPEISSEIFDISDDSLRVRSSILADYFIRECFRSEDIVAWTYRIVIEAVRRKAERSSRAILSSLMRFSVLYRALSDNPERISMLSDLFEQWRRHDLMSREPLFWLQYAILMTESNELDAAESFIEMAYSRAAEIDGFQTYQIDTYALKLMLIIETGSLEASRVLRFDKIVEKLDRVRSMIGDDNHRIHAVEVLSEIEPFVSARIGSMSESERVALIYQTALLMQKLSALSQEEKIASGAGQVMLKIGHVREIILQAR